MRRLWYGAIEIVVVIMGYFFNFRSDLYHGSDLPTVKYKYKTKSKDITKGNMNNKQHTENK